MPESTDELSKALDNSLEDQEHLSLSEDTPSPANITPCGIAPVGYEVNCVSTEAQFTAAIKKKDNVYIGLTANIQVRSSIDNKYQPGLLAPLTKANYVIEGNGFSLIGPNNTDSGLIDHFSLLGITESGLQTYSFQNITLIGTSKGGIINIPKSHPQSFFSFKNVVFKGLHVLSVSHSPVILEDSEFHLLSSADVKALPEYQSFTATIKTADAVTLFTAPEVQIRNQVRLESDVLSKADLMRTEKLTVSANANLKVKANGVIKTDLVQ